ncbi:unnamed protein product [Coregonus sp. 'balchen']|nr:unnamed protein product [Coregonus sp. 'balchen']
MDENGERAEKEEKRCGHMEKMPSLVCPLLRSSSGAGTGTGSAEGSEDNVRSEQKHLEAQDQEARCLGLWSFLRAYSGLGWCWRRSDAAARLDAGGGAMQQQGWMLEVRGNKQAQTHLTMEHSQIITPGTKAAGGSLVQGDIIASINGLSTEGMTHLEAQNKIKIASNKLTLTMQKSKRPVSIPMATPRMDSPMPVIPHQKCLPRARRGSITPPLACTLHTLREMALLQGKVAGEEAGAARLGGEGATSGVPFMGQEYVPNFNPIALKDSALSTHKPIEVRGPGGKATIVHAHASPVYQAVIQPHDRDEEMAEWARRAANLQSKSFRILAHLTGTEYMQDPDEEALQRSRDKFESEVKGPRFQKLKNWHNGLSAGILNVPETPF